MNPRTQLLAGTFDRGIAWPAAALCLVGFRLDNWQAGMACCPLLQGQYARHGIMGAFAALDFAVASTRSHGVAVKHRLAHSTTPAHLSCKCHKH